MKIVNIKESSFDKTSILNFFIEVNNDFKPTLTERIEQKSDVKTIELYCDKLFEKAELVICIVDNRIAGLMAFYSNNKVTKEAFISLLCVKQEYRKLGIGKEIMIHCISKIKRSGMKYIKIETNSDNYIAIKLYENLGFKIVNTMNNTDYLTREL
jgi:ribosomal protein S18 acetylase RimI-like enzyme